MKKSSIKLKSLFSLLESKGLSLDCFNPETAKERTPAQLESLEKFIETYGDPFSDAIDKNSAEIDMDLFRMWISAFQCILSDKDEENLPRRGTSRSAGYDLRVPCGQVIKAGTVGRVIFPYIFAHNEEKSVVAMVVARSSLFKNHGLIPLERFHYIPENAMLYIDLYNPGKEDVHLEEGERVAQVIFTDAQLTLFDQQCFTDLKEVPPTEVPHRRTANIFVTCPKEQIIPAYGNHLVSISLGVQLEEDEFVILGSIYDHIVDNFPWLLANGVGIIDSDYFGNPSNGGEIFANVYNNSIYPLVLQQGQPFCVMRKMKYLITENDDAKELCRDGGFGSTGR